LHALPFDLMAERLASTGNEVSFGRFESRRRSEALEGLIGRKALAPHQPLHFALVRTEAGPDLGASSPSIGARTG